jgi:HEPN domain-containing protein
MDRLEWQKLAERWLVDAKRLLDDRRWSAAYYLAGYAVECGLKACILKRLSATPEVIFESRRFSDNCWTHDLKELLKLAGLELAMDTDTATNPALDNNWIAAKDWNEKRRYENIVYSRAKKLYAAIADKRNGVMQWIKGHW